MPDLFPIKLKCQLTSLTIHTDQIEYFSRVERIFHHAHTPFFKHFSKCPTENNSLLKENFQDDLTSKLPDLIFLGMEDCFAFSIEVLLNMESRLLIIFCFISIIFRITLDYKIIDI